MKVKIIIPNPKRNLRDPRTRIHNNYNYYYYNYKCRRQAPKYMNRPTIKVHSHAIHMHSLTHEGCQFPTLQPPPHSI